MPGIALEIELGELDKLQRHLDSFAAKVKNPAALLDGLAGLLETQTKRRIADEKASPDGTKWAPWSAAYAKTRSGAKSLLVDSQSLLDTIAGSVNGNAAMVGSELVYAPPNQRTRPFLGLSDANSSEILQLVEDWIGGIL